MENQIWHRFYDSQVPRKIDYPDQTLYQLFQEAVERNPHGIATVFFGAKKSYRQLGKDVDQFSASLQSRGLGPGDRVALILPNLPGYPIAHFAVMKMGGVLVPTNPLYVERELQHQLNDSGARAVVILDQLYPKLEKIRNQTKVEQVILMSVRDFLPLVLGLLYRLKNRQTISSNPDAGVFNFRQFMRLGKNAKPAASVSPRDTAMLLYTGGTTGVSKGAELTHHNIASNVLQTRSWLWSMREEGEVLFCVLPFFHSYGMTTGLHLAVIARSTMLLLPRFDLADVARQIKKHRPTIFCGVPSMYQAINRYPSLSASDVSSIRLCVSGGAGLPAEVQKEFESRTGGKLVEGYGLTESSPVALVNPIHGQRKSGTIGVPISDTDAKIVDLESGEPLPPGETGELLIKGPQVMKGYWGKPEETSKVLADGWLRTGDVARMDEEGFFTIVDRQKDVIISAGMNVYPREVEEVLLQHPKIVEAAVLGISSSVREEVVKAYIVLEAGADLAKSDVIEFLRDKLSKFKIPRKVEFVEELPKSAMGKVLKRVLKEQAPPE